VGIYVQEGQSVRKGQLLAQFDSRDLREQRIQAASKRDEYETTATTLAQSLPSLRGDAQERTRTEADNARFQADAYASQVRLLNEQLRRINDLYAPRDGVVMGIPKRAEIGKLFDKSYVQGKPVCIVGDPSRLVIKVPVTPIEFKVLKEDLEPGTELEASIYVTGRTDQIFTGKVRQLPESDAKQVAFPLTQRGGGPLAVKPSGEEGKQELSPVAQVYLVDVELTDPDATIKPGALVNVKIHAKWRSGGWWVKRKLAEALDIGLY